MAGDETATRNMGGDGADDMHLVDWWLTTSLYYILPDRVYWYLGANASDSQGENEWYHLLTLLRLQAPHWAQGRSPRDSSSGSDMPSLCSSSDSPRPACRRA